MVWSSRLSRWFGIALVAAFAVILMETAFKALLQSYEQGLPPLPVIAHWRSLFFIGGIVVVGGVFHWIVARVLFLATVTGWEQATATLVLRLASTLPISYIVGSLFGLLATTVVPELNNLQASLVIALVVATAFAPTTATFMNAFVAGRFAKEQQASDMLRIERRYQWSVVFNGEVRKAQWLATFIGAARLLIELNFLALGQTSWRQATGADAQAAMQSFHDIYVASFSPTIVVILLIVGLVSHVAAIGLSILVRPH